MDAEDEKQWAPICQDCWREMEPTEYFPDTEAYDTCYTCGAYGLVTHKLRSRILLHPGETGFHS